MYENSIRFDDATQQLVVDYHEMLFMKTRQEREAVEDSNREFLSSKPNALYRLAPSPSRMRIFEKKEVLF